MPKTYTAPAAFADQKEFRDIPMQAVTSNQVKAIGYDLATKTLACTFTRGPGHIYHYADVEPETHAAFVKAESIGTYFGQHIKPLAFKKFKAPEADTAAQAE